MIRGTLTIYGRELAGLFLQPFVWVLLFVSTLLLGWLFAGTYLPGANGDVHRATMIALGGDFWFWVLTLVLAPLVTMRMISEEARSGVLEYLLTAPVPDASVVLGKLLAATTFFVVLWGTCAVPALVATIGGVTPDWSQILVAWLGTTLVCALFCAVGLTASAMSQTPVLAAFLAFLFALILLVSRVALRLFDAIPDDVLPRSWIEFVVDKLDVVGRYQVSFRNGVLDSAHVLFFVVWIACFVFFTVRLLEMRRWR
ncbi:MAG: ABC transporter permease subunit [Planctomycetota bacterium]